MIDAPIPPRLARLVLVTPDGEVVGALPPFGVASPWWQDAEPVVNAARERHGIDVTVLRLLDTELPIPHGGTVTYLAEVAHPVSAEPWDGTLDDQPLRMAWARPGGPSPSAIRSERPGPPVRRECKGGSRSRAAGGRPDRRGPTHPRAG